MTKEERKLWYDFLKSLPIVFKRQKVIGNYVVDFYCSSRKLVIEIDGSGHFETKKEAEDLVRTEYLNGLGISVARYTNLDINKRFNDVCVDILRRLGIE